MFMRAGGVYLCKRLKSLDIIVWNICLQKGGLRMQRWKSIALAFSLLLNVFLIIGLLGVRYYARKALFKQAAISSGYLSANCKHVLSIIDSNDPKQIPELKKFLQSQIENNNRAAESWRKALKK
jgi:hypothetical protein